MDNKTESIIRANFEEALLGFDFEKVHSVMEFLDWEWHGKDGRHVPSIVEMIRNLEDLLKSAISFMDNGFSSVGTGGFMVEIFEDNDVEISFIIADSRSYSEATDNTVG